VFWQKLDRDQAEGADRQAAGAAAIIAGEGAQTLYNSMSVKVQKNYCDEEGLLAKQAGDLICLLNTKSRDPKDRYSCNFGIMLNTGRTTWTSIC
jgi:hypothetical protein